MGKILTTYGGFTAAEMKSRSSIPAQGDITVNSNNIDCRKISLSAVKNLLGAATYRLSDICNHSNVNKWSCFGSREFYIDGGSLLDRVKTPYALGDFAGYNHDAPLPIAPNASFVFTRVGSSRTISVGMRCKVGEYDWGRLFATHCKVSVYDGGTLFSESGIKPLNTGGNWIIFDAINMTFSTASIYTKNYTTKITLCQDDGNELFDLPIMGQITIEVISPIVNNLVVFVDGLPNRWQMQGDVLYAGNSMYRTGKRTSNGSVNGKSLSSIVYKVYNTANEIIDTATVTSFNANEYPTVLDIYSADDLEIFYADFDVSSGRPHPYTDQYMNVEMYYV